MNRSWLIITALALGCAGVACSDDGGSNTSDGAGGEGAGAAGGNTGVGGAGGDSGLDCPNAQPPFLDTGGEASACLGTVSGQVLDQDGNPPQTTTITVCGDACIFGDLNADGSFVMEVDHCYKKSAFYAVPIMIYHGWPEYADVTVKLVPDGMTNVPNADVGVITTVATAAMKKYDYADAVAGTFDDDNGFSIAFGECEMRLPAFQDDVYMAHVSLDDFPLGTPPTDLLDLYFVAPDNTFFTTPATVRFPNTTQLPPGTVVELMALGNMGTTTVIEAGTFDVVGSGRVTDDGNFVESVPGQDSGLISLGWLGYREAP